jgi:diguanylate cyclase (GGDEF)-like protein
MADEHYSICMPVVLANFRAGVRFLVLALLITGAATAQRYSFRTYAEAEGLTDLTVNSILQDHDGFLWVATMSGISRFDGRHFRTYGVAEGLPSSLVLSSIETPDGQIWVDTPAGVARLEGDRFVKVDTGGHVPNRCPQCIAQGGERMYIATTSGLFWRSVHGGSGIIPGTEHEAVVAVLPVRGTAARNAGNNMGVWYSVNGGVCSLLGDSTTHCYSKEAGLPADRWGGIAIDNGGTVWVRSSRHLMTLASGASKFESRDSGLPIATRVGAISLDSHGMPMVATESGLARWNGPDSGGKPWSLIGVGNGLAVPSVSWAIEDREGSIWVGMLGGGFARWLGAGEWESWTSQQGLPDDQITAIQRDRKGRLLIGSASGMDMMDGQRIAAVPIGSLGTAGNHLRAIAVGEGASLWLGTSPEGVGVLDTETGSVRRFDASSGLGITDVRALVVDRQGAVWAGGVGGIFRGVRGTGGKDREAWIWQHVYAPSGVESSDFIVSIVEDGEGRIWFGGSLGVSYWDGLREVRLGPLQGMPEGTVGTLGRAPDGTVWVGVNDLPDLYHIVPSANAGEGTAFTVQPFRGPASAKRGGPVYVLGFDQSGNLWRGGSAGVDAYVQGHWVQYTRADGLVWNDTSRNTFLADADGSVWIGTSHGLSHHLRITAQADTGTGGNRATIVGLQAGGRNLSLAGTPAIDYHAGNYVISFASPVFRRDKDVRFRYRLKGLDRSWTETTEWDARYSRLKPRHYVFEVESGGWDGNWSADPARISFIVTGPFWTSAWFTPAWIGSLALLTFAGWRVRDLAHGQREGELREAVSERTRELEKERHREKARNRILENLVSNQSIALVLDGIAELLCDQMGSGAAVVLLRHADVWRAGAAPGCPADWVAALETPGSIPNEICVAPWLCRVPGGEPAWHNFMSRAGSRLPCGMSSVPIDGPDGAIGAVLFFYSYSAATGLEPWREILGSAARMAQVVIEHTRLYDGLQYQAHHDSLTGLPNRASFSGKLARAVENAREFGEMIAVLFIDIDCFKEINDRLSHRAGDIVLSTLARRMKSVVRDRDTVARIGGDEFNILLENVPGPDAVAEIAACVLAAVREPLYIDGARLDVSASIGMSIFPDDASDPEELQREADAAMYCAKGLGRNRMQAFGDRDGVLDGAHIDQALRQALQEGLFRVHYQPKVGSDGSFAGFEALLRLDHPKLGNLPPALFNPLAEAKGLIVPIGMWVLNEVCRQIAEWRDRGFGEIPVAINVSPIQIARPDFAALVRECLRQRNVSPLCVELELTEQQA